ESDTPQTDVFPFGECVFYAQDYQFTEKILRYDEDVSDIIDYIFSGVSLNKEEHDKHIKKGFLSRFVNRQINRQTVEAFKMELLSTFISNETFINTLYEDLEKYIRSEEHTSELQSRFDLVCRLLLEKKKKTEKKKIEKCKKLITVIQS